MEWVWVSESSLFFMLWEWSEQMLAHNNAETQMLTYKLGYFSTVSGLLLMYVGKKIGKIHGLSEIV